MDGLRRPSGLNNVSLFILAKGSLGFGSLGVPSTLAQRPTVLFQPTMALSMQQLSWDPCRIMDSLILTPGPTITFGPTVTFGPSWTEAEATVALSLQTR
uniref:Uncharacterized protein n=1 Tax=Eptatretus burgeri TaxID=7764 RepID=A0A8C4WVI4_EPTBU